MAASGKKKGKKKGKTLNLNEFLSTGDSSPAPGTSFVYASKSSWADEAPEVHGDFSSSPWKDSSSSSMSGRIALPTAPKSAQQVEIDLSKLPENPPYTIYLGNLPFDLSTDEIKAFLVQSDCNVSDVRLPTDGDQMRLKGFGYAEVDDIDSLYKALSLNNTQLRSRRIRVDLASQAQTDGKGGDRGFDKTAGDWRRGDNSNRSEWNQGGDRFGSSNRSSDSDRDRWRDRPAPENPDSFGGGRDRGGGSFGGRDGDRGGFGRDRGGGGGFERNYDRGGGGGGFERNYDRGGGGGFDRGGSDSRSFGREWDRDRGSSDRGGYSRGSDRGGYNQDGDRGFDRRNDRGPDRGYDRGPDRGYNQSRGGGFERDEGRDGWRKNEEVRPPGRGESIDGPPSDREPPRERKRLVLTKRTQPIEKSAAPAASVSSIFGGAKPVDTAAKERQIEERLEREKRESEQHKQTQNIEKEPPRKESSQEHVRVRRDSERSEGRTEGRTRHSSSGSGRGGPRPVIMRRESERSNDEEVFHKDDQAPVSPTPTSPPPPKTPTSPRQDDVKLVPAPPPKENAWAKRSETVASPPAGGGGAPRPSSQGSSERPHSESGAWRDGSSDRPRGGGRGGGSGPPPGRGRGQGQRPDGGGRGGGGGVGGRGAPMRDGEKRGPPRDNGPPRTKPQGTLPKFEEPKPRDWSDSNKFSSFLEDEVGNLSD